MITSAILSCSRLGAWDIIAAGADKADEDSIPPIPPNPPGSTLKRLSVSLKPIAQGSGLIDFPVLIRLTAANFPYASARSDGMDIRFKADDGTTALDFERESWNPSGVSDYWVKIPALAASPADTTIWIYFGDDSSTDASHASGVWTNGYIAVLHGGYTDVALERYYVNSVGSNDPNTEGPSDPPGDLVSSTIIGSYGFRFDGSNNKDGVLFPAVTDYNDLGPLTFETWIYDRGSPPGGLLFYKGANFALSIQASEAVRFLVGYTPTALDYSSPTVFLSSTAWTNFVLTWNGLSVGSSLVSMYANGLSGALVGTGPAGIRDSDAAESLIFGNDGSPSPPYRHLVADLDEIRISNVVRSAAWIRAQYLSQLGDQVIFGSAEAVKSVR